MAKETKITVNLAPLNDYRKQLAEGWKAKVGIFGSKAGGNHEGGITNAQLGILHEFGGTIHHPGGTPYTTDSTGKATFIPESEATPSTPRTKPHNITIPPRSWLRMPIETKKDVLMKFMGLTHIKKLFEQGHIYEIMLQLGAKASEIINSAFLSGGFGRWAQNKPSTVAKKGSSAPLIDTGELRRSVAYDAVQTKK